MHKMVCRKESKPVTTEKWTVRDTSDLDECEQWKWCAGVDQDGI